MGAALAHSLLSFFVMEEKKGERERERERRIKPHDCVKEDALCLLRGGSHASELLKPQPKTKTKIVLKLSFELSQPDLATHCLSSAQSHRFSNH
jgi:hypothetical protein